MSAAIYYRFFHSGHLLGEGSVEAPFTVGRQTDDRLPPPVSTIEVSPDSPHFAANASVPRKLVIVPLSNRSVPRLSLKIEVDHRGNLLAYNLHRAVELNLSTQQRLHPQEQVSLGVKASIGFPDEYELQLSLETGEADSGSAAQARCKVPDALAISDQVKLPNDSGAIAIETVPSIDAPSPAARASRFSQCLTPAVEVNADDIHGSCMALNSLLCDAEQASTHLLSMIAKPESVNHQELAVRLVRAALEAFKEPPGSKEFFDAAGRAAMQMIDLDRVAVLRKEHGQWVCRTLFCRPGLDPQRSASRRFSQTLLTQMEHNQRTTCISPQCDEQSVWKSIVEIDRAVAAPIFDEQKAIVAALYGDRLIGESDNHEPISELEAALLEVIATGISSSLAIKQEQRLRSSMAQFFSPVILEQLKQDPALLDGRVAEVSVLFCDIRGFSTVTERIGPTQSVAWINDVLTTLSQCVLAHDGVLVDYIGDELMAMWGAPATQEDHASRACRAALDMLAEVEPLREKWKSIICERFDLGIGINSGPASVGNTGSKQKFKYGPLGNAVNLASRVQGITKQVGIPGLITGQTARQLPDRDSFPVRRLAKVRVVGIVQPIDLFELRRVAEGIEPKDDLCRRYEQALQAFEVGDPKRAAGGLASLVQDYPDDRPTIMLLSRAVERLTQSDGVFDPVWNLTQK